MKLKIYFINNIVYQLPILIIMCNGYKNKLLYYTILCRHFEVYRQVEIIAKTQIDLLYSNI